MTSLLSPHPELIPLARLQVSNGLLLTAERWEKAHTYHRQRQNIHFQAQQTAGIVCGLGVGVSPAPAEVSARYRDARWVRIQPGLAIDTFGNPIVVPEAMYYRITAHSTEPQMIYLVASYVDPTCLTGHQEQEFIQETFRIEEQTTPPAIGEVELCRIQLQTQSFQLENPTDLFAPGINQLDLRYRCPVVARSVHTIRAAQLSPNQESAANNRQRFLALFNALDGLYAKLDAIKALPQLETLEPGKDEAQANSPAHRVDAFVEPITVEEVNLIHTNYQDLQNLPEHQQGLLKRYLATGGVLIVETSTDLTVVNELTQIQNDLKAAIHELRQEHKHQRLQKQLEEELSLLRASTDDEIYTLLQPLIEPLALLGVDLSGNGAIHPQHPLRSMPFRFQRWPECQGQPLEILNWGGMIVVIGPLSQQWGTDEGWLDRESLRTAQELGINLLYFAQQRRQLYQGLVTEESPSPSSSTAETSSESLEEA